MTENKVENYTEIELVDFGRKVKIFSDEIEKINFFKEDSTTFFPCRVLRADVSSQHIKFILDLEEENPNWDIARIELQGMDYYLKGIIEKDETDEEYVFSIDQNVYKDDRRYSDRLLTYPHHMSYLYLNFEGGHEVESNIIQFGRKKDLSKPNFLKLTSLFVSSVIDKFETSKIDLKKLKMFRVLDLSKNGLAILASKYEKKFFEDQKNFKGLVEISGKLCPLENLVFLYSIDYIDNRFPQIPIFKIGLTFREENELSDFLNESIDEKNNRVNKESLAELFS